MWYKKEKLVLWEGITKFKRNLLTISSSYGGYIFPLKNGFDFTINPLGVNFSEEHRKYICYHLPDEKIGKSARKKSYRTSSFWEKLKKLNAINQVNPPDFSLHKFYIQSVSS